MTFLFDSLLKNSILQDEHAVKTHLFQAFETLSGTEKTAECNNCNDHCKQDFENLNDEEEYDGKKTAVLRVRGLILEIITYN